MPPHREDFETAVRKDLSYMREQLDALVHTLDGNGKPGLKREVDRLKLKMWVVWSLLFVALTAGVESFVSRGMQPPEQRAAAGK